MCKFESINLDIEIVKVINSFILKYQILFEESKTLSELNCKYSEFTGAINFMISCKLIDISESKNLFNLIDPAFEKKFDYFSSFERNDNNDILSLH